jgi:hypothetical protein
VAVPSSAGFDEARWTRVESIIVGALNERPASVRGQVGLFLRALDIFSRVRHLRGLARLRAPQALRLMQALERSRVPLLRRGVWGVRTLAFMGCYADERARDEIGYVALPLGWEARGARAGAWPGRAGAAPPEAGSLLGDAPGPSDA